MPDSEINLNLEGFDEVGRVATTARLDFISKCMEATREPLSVVMRELFSTRVPIDETQDVLSDSRVGCHLVPGVWLRERILQETHPDRVVLRYTARLEIDGETTGGIKVPKP